MSGHSHWHTIKHKKGLADAKKGQAFSKVTREITLTAREGGKDPNTNAKLRLAIEKARTLNMPSDNIERAVKRGIGELEDERLEPVLFEAYGPGKIALIIEGITDNRNRASNEIKTILTQHNGKLAAEGSVKWLFERKGTVTIFIADQTPDFQNKEIIELAAIEAEASDFYWHDDRFDVYTKPEDLEKAKKYLEGKGIKTESASLDWVARELIPLGPEEMDVAQKLFEALDENEAVQEIYSNLKI